MGRNQFVTTAGGDEDGVLVEVEPVGRVPVGEDAGVAGEVGGVHAHRLGDEVVEMRGGAGADYAAYGLLEAPAVVAVALQERVQELGGVQTVRWG